MQNNTNIQNKIDATLSSIDGLQRAEPRPFFYTRLAAKLNNSGQNTWERFSIFITRPATAFAGVLLIVMMNIFAAYSNFKNTDATDQTEVTATTVDEYSQTATNFYDFENMKP